MSAGNISSFMLEKIVKDFHNFGVSVQSSLDDLRTAYKRKARETHPDKGGDARKFQELQASYIRVKKIIEQKILRGRVKEEIPETANAATRVRYVRENRRQVPPVVKRELVDPPRNKSSGSADAPGSSKDTLAYIPTRVPTVSTYPRTTSTSGLSREHRTRTSSLSQEHTTRKSALSQKPATRTSTQSQEPATRTSAQPRAHITRKSSRSQKPTRRTSTLSREHATRTSALSQEPATRTSALSQEHTTRMSALSRAHATRRIAQSREHITRTRALSREHAPRMSALSREPRFAPVTRSVINQTPQDPPEATTSQASVPSSSVSPKNCDPISANDTRGSAADTSGMPSGSSCVVRDINVVFAVNANKVSRGKKSTNMATQSGKASKVTKLKTIHKVTQMDEPATRKNIGKASMLFKVNKLKTIKKIGKTKVTNVDKPASKMNIENASMPSKVSKLRTIKRIGKKKFTKVDKPTSKMNIGNASMPSKGSKLKTIKRIGKKKFTKVDKPTSTMNIGNAGMPSNVDKLRTIKRMDKKKVTKVDKPDIKKKVTMVDKRNGNVTTAKSMKKVKKVDKKASTVRAAAAPSRRPVVDTRARATSTGEHDVPEHSSPRPTATSSHDGYACGIEFCDERPLIQFIYPADFFGPPGRRCARHAPTSVRCSIRNCGNKTGNTSLCAADHHGPSGLRCATHGGTPVCNVPFCASKVRHMPTRFIDMFGVPGLRCPVHFVDRRCQVVNCKNLAFGNATAISRCRDHGGGFVCDIPDCTKAAACHHVMRTADNFGPPGHRCVGHRTRAHCLCRADRFCRVKGCRLIALAKNKKARCVNHVDQVKHEKICAVGKCSREAVQVQPLRCERHGGMTRCTFPKCDRISSAMKVIVEDGHGEPEWRCWRHGGRVHCHKKRCKRGAWGFLDKKLCCKLHGGKRCTTDGCYGLGQRVRKGVVQCKRHMK